MSHLARGPGQWGSAARRMHPEADTSGHEIAGTPMEAAP
jgi:hypothetical protein